MATLGKAKGYSNSIKMQSVININKIYYAIIVVYIAFTTVSLAQEKEHRSRLILEKYSNNEKLDLNLDDTLIVKKGKLFTEEETALILREFKEHIFLLEVFEKSGNNWIIKFSDQVEFGFYLGIEFNDVNKDGVKDIILKTASGRRDDILYLSIESLRFKRITGLYEINLFPESENYIYTYVATGCADQYWESDLISFNGTKLKKVARIEVNECDDMNYNYQAFVEKEYSLKQIDKLWLAPKKSLELSEYWETFIIRYLKSTN